jgi:hypothetical protein
VESEEGPETARCIAESDFGLMVRGGVVSRDMEGRGGVRERYVGPGTMRRIYIDI